MRPLLTSLTMLVFLLTIPHAALGACSKKRIAGDYAMAGQIQSVREDLTQVTLVTLGRVTLNSRGNLSVEDAVLVLGSSREEIEGSGSYTINRDCSGTATMDLRTDNGRITWELDMVVSGTLEETVIQLLYTETGDAGNFEDSGLIRLEEISL